jgi:predicted enzyme related to lactoylglutathione lyase
MAKTSKGHFVWHEHMTRDPKAAIAFYSEVVGWKTQPFGQLGDYQMWVGSQGPLGGVMKLPAELEKIGVPPHWMGNVQVDDVDATVALAQKLGGKIHNPPEDVPTVGRVAVIADPQGAAIAVFAPAQVMDAHDTSKEGEFCWNELVTSDHAAAFRFYAELFGWQQLQQMDMGPMGQYVIYGIGEKQLGGMMNVPPDVPMPPSWVYYTETLDIEAAIGRATKQGAKVMVGPMDVPGGGKVAQLSDPQGAVFALHQSPKK